MVPFNSDGSKVVKYIAADRDKKSVKLLRHILPGWVTADL